MRPDWVVNTTKYDRAVLEVTRSGKEVTEEAVKAVYVRLAGLLLEDAPEAAQEHENLPEVKKRKNKK